MSHTVTCVYTHCIYTLYTHTVYTHCIHTVIDTLYEGKITHVCKHTRVIYPPPYVPLQKSHTVYSLASPMPRRPDRRFGVLLRQPRPLLSSPQLWPLLVHHLQEMNQGQPLPRSLRPRPEYEGMGQSGRGVSLTLRLRFRLRFRLGFMLGLMLG